MKLTANFNATKKAFIYLVSQDYLRLKATHRVDKSIKHHALIAMRDLKDEGFIVRNENKMSRYELTAKGRKAYFELQEYFRKNTLL